MNGAAASLDRQLATVDGLYVGAARAHWPDKPPSAIGKTPIDQARIGSLGLEGDEQADLSVHGGPDKALHWYPANHYAAWAEALPERAERFKPGGLGENLSTSGLTEADLHLGDVLRLGSARLQISHGRAPCWKLDAHLELTDFAYRMRKSGRTGWYCRVLETGDAAIGDPITLEARPQPDWPLARVIAAMNDPRASAETLSALAALPELAAAWREAVQARLAR